MRLYGAQPNILDGSYRLPAMAEGRLNGCCRGGAMRRIGPRQCRKARRSTSTNSSSVLMRQHLRFPALRAPFVGVRRHAEASSPCQLHRLHCSGKTRHDHYPPEV